MPPDALGRSAMKHLYGFFILIACALSCGAGEWSTAPLAASAAAAVSETSPLIAGEIDSVYVDCAAGTTQTVAVASSIGPVFSLAGITADSIYRPRVVGAGTNNAAISTAIGERIYLSGHALTVTVTATQSPTNNVVVKINFK